MACEMNRNLRQLVDNCFEENQFDAAVATLDLLRSTNHLPSPIHLLYLLFISLHPTTHPVNLENPEDQPLNHAALLQQSPRKIVKQSRTPQLLLTPSAVLAASRALHAFLRTNGPSAFSNAIPFYPDSRSKSSSSASTAHHLEFVDSPIYTNVLAIHTARSVWEVVKSGFTIRAAKAIPPPALAKTRTTKQKLARDASFTDSTLSVAQLDDLKPVGEHSWLILDFYVSLFEADARESSSPKHSLLLLKQLPPPPLGSQTRWDTSEPLKVAFYALSQDDDRKQRIGLRLLLLLIDLTRTIYLNQPAFASAVVAQLSSFFPPTSFSSSSTANSNANTNANGTATTSPHTPHTPPSKKKRKLDPSPKQLEHPKAVDYLFALLPSDTPARMLFRMTLCRKLLAGLSEHDDEDEGGSIDMRGRGNLDVGVGVDMNGGYGVGGMMASMPSTTDGNANLNGNANGMVNGISNGNVNGIAKPRPRPKPIPRRKKLEDEKGADKEKEKEKEEEKGKETETKTKMDKGKGKAKADPVPTDAPAPAPNTNSPQKTTATRELSPPPPPPPPPAPIQRVPIPSFGELACVLRLGLRQGGAGEDGALMRVRFELVMVWINLSRCDAGGEGDNGNGKRKEKTVLDDRGTREDLGRVLDEVFGPFSGVYVEGQSEGEVEGDRSFYRRVLNAFVGV